MKKIKNNKIIIYGLFGLLLGIIIGIVIITNFKTIGNSTKTTMAQSDQVYTTNASGCPCTGPNTEYCTGNVICCCGGMPGCCSRNGEKVVSTIKTN